MSSPQEDLQRVALSGKCCAAPCSLNLRDEIVVLDCIEYQASSKRKRICLQPSAKNPHLHFCSATFLFEQQQSHSITFCLQMRSASALLLLIALIASSRLVFSQTNYCCNEPNFGSDWCHSSSCLGDGCRNEPDAQGQSQSNYLCDDLSSCVCAGACQCPGDDVQRAPR